MYVHKCEKDDDGNWYVDRHSCVRLNARHCHTHTHTLTHKEVEKSEDSCKSCVRESVSKPLESVARCIDIYIILVVFSCISFLRVSIIFD